MVDLGWRSVGVLELTALPSIDEEHWKPLVRETDVFSDAFASTGANEAWIEGHRREGPRVTGNYFQVLGGGRILGRKPTPSDEQPGGPPVIVHHHAARVT